MAIATDKQGNRVLVGDTVISFRGELYEVRAFTPASGVSEGRVYVVSNPESTGIGHGYYPSVFGLTVVEGN